MPYNLVARATGKTIPLTALTKDGLDVWLKKTDKHLAAWVGAAGFDASAGTTLLLPGKGGGITRILLGVDGDDDIWSWSAAVERLPRGRYAIPRQTGAKMATNAALGWALGTYVFDRYKRVARPEAELVWPAQADRKAVEGMASSIYLTRDLINTPASDLGPAELAVAVRKLAREFKASCNVIVGDNDPSDCGHTGMSFWLELDIGTGA